jgi:AraC-like DNA-binding protein
MESTLNPSGKNGEVYPHFYSPSHVSSNDWLARLQEVVERRIHEFDLKAEDIARDLCMSRTQFFRQMRKDLGQTPSEFVEAVRFQRAKELLSSGEAESVKSTAFDVGFRHVKYFSRLFKERYGNPPSAFLVRKSSN